MTTPDTQTAAPADRDDGSYQPYSGLETLLRDCIPESIGFDANHAYVYPLTAEALSMAESHASCAAVSMLSGLAVVGKLLIHTDPRELSVCDWHDLGDLITTTAGSVHALLQIADAARDAVAGIVVDSIADKKIVHKNKAARHKSRLSAAIKAMA